MHLEMVGVCSIVMLVFGKKNPRPMFEGRISRVTSWEPGRNSGFLQPGDRLTIQIYHQTQWYGQNLIPTTLWGLVVDLLSFWGS